jgi:hypothetical protein
MLFLCSNQLISVHLFAFSRPLISFSARQWNFSRILGGLGGDDVKIDHHRLPNFWWKIFQLPTPADSGQLYKPCSFFFPTKKKCHAGRFDDSYRRHSAFDSLSLSFFEMNTRARKCLDALTMLGHVNFMLGYLVVGTVDLCSI